MTSMPAMRVFETLPLSVRELELLQSVNDSVAEHMASFDSSHDLNHCLRVLAVSKHILDEEHSLQIDNTIDRLAVFLAALMHDIDDHKYATANDSDNAIKDILLKKGAPPVLASKVQAISKSVSYSTEIRSPQLVQAALSQHPELAIVQDADRLDALGAVGIGRLFTYGGAKQPDRGLQGSIDHIGTKLEKLEGMMKTRTGTKMARERTARLRIFRTWFSEEIALEH